MAPKYWLYHLQVTRKLLQLYFQHLTTKKQLQKAITIWSINVSHPKVEENSDKTKIKKQENTCIKNQSRFYKANRTHDRSKRSMKYFNQRTWKYIHWAPYCDQEYIRTLCQTVNTTPTKPCTNGKKHMLVKSSVFLKKRSNMQTTQDDELHIIHDIHYIYSERVWETCPMDV